MFLVIKDGQMAVGLLFAKFYYCMDRRNSMERKPPFMYGPYSKLSRIVEITVTQDDLEADHRLMAVERHLLIVGKIKGMVEKKNAVSVQSLEQYMTKGSCGAITDAVGNLHLS